jgi:hypothetical protein
MPLWAERTLGPVPENPLERQDWLNRAAAIEAFREMKGWRSLGDPIGAAPDVAAPEHRAAWHTALIALASVDGIDLSHVTERQLQARRALYAQETSRAPLHPGRELRLSRLARDHATVRVNRARREATAAADPQARDKHISNARSWAALRDRAAEAATLYESAMAIRQEWQRIAEHTLRIAQAADLELRRRDPWTRHEPVISMEPESDLIDGSLQPTDADILHALGLTVDATQLSGHPQRTAEAARQAQARLDDLVTLREPEEDDQIAPTEAWGRQAARQREALTQRSRPRVRPSQRVIDMEAGR